MESPRGYIYHSALIMIVADIDLKRQVDAFPHKPPNKAMVSAFGGTFYSVSRLFLVGKPFVAAWVN